MTIKEKWARFGIKYDPKTGRIYCDPLGMWIMPLLKFGTNTKVGKAATFSILHGNETRTLEDYGPKAREIMKKCGLRSIDGTCPCHCKDCYCDSGFYNMDSTRASILINTIIVRYYLDWFKNAVIAQIIIQKIKQVRIHATGDFFSKEYTTTWHEIIDETEIGTDAEWSYTKWDYAVHAFDDLPTMSMVNSNTPFGVNFGTCEYLITLMEKLISAGYPVHICACGTEYEKHCSDCTVGCKNKGVFTLFILHSTKEYKAGEKDPEAFEAVKEIIRNQIN